MTESEALIRAESVALERAGVRALAEGRGRDIDRLVERGLLSPEDGVIAKRQVSAFADDIVAGLHIEAVDAKAVRIAVRAALGVTGA